MSSAAKHSPNRENLCFCRLGIADLDEMLAIEEAVYSHPWTRGNFLDSFYSNHEAGGIRDANGSLLAYFLVMPVVDELHLLTFAVSKDKQRQGLALGLLDNMLRYARDRKFVSILLEVRVSNHRAIEIYRRFGFQDIGLRKAYYPAVNGAREDAFVMRIEISQS